MEKVFKRSRHKNKAGEIMRTDDMDGSEIEGYKEV